MDYENIILEKEGSVAIITLNRPKVLNALTFPMIQEIIDAIDKVGKDDEARAVVITGAGRGFCSGDDIGKGMGIPPGVISTQGHGMVMKGIRNLRKPVIAAVNGNAHGSGSDIMLSCDFRIASEDAKLGDLRGSRGLVIGTGATYLLPALVGLAKAIELIFTGKMIDAKEAEAMGLVSKVVPAAELMKETKAFAAKLAKMPPMSVEFVKRMAYAGLDTTLLPQIGLEQYHANILSQTEDFKEGVTAFREKREAIFKGL